MFRLKDKDKNAILMNNQRHEKHEFDIAFHNINLLTNL